MGQFSRRMITSRLKMFEGIDLSLSFDAYFGLCFS